MKKIYIFTPYECLSEALTNMLDIIGYLPINISNSTKNISKLKLNNESIFTHYSCLQSNKEFLRKFKNIITFIPHEEVYIDTEIVTKNYNNIIFFSKILTLKNIQKVLQDIENNSTNLVT